MREWLSDNVYPLLFPNWGWPLLVLGLVLLALVYAWWPDVVRLATFGLFVISTLAMLWWFLSVFAGTDYVDEQAAHNMLVFCYAFTFISLLVSILPVIVFLTVPSGFLSALYLETAQSPFGMVRGCVHVVTEADKEWELVSPERHLCGSMDREHRGIRFASSHSITMSESQSHTRGDCWGLGVDINRDADNDSDHGGDCGSHRDRDDHTHAVRHIRPRESYREH